MSKLAEYYQKNYYPDMDISVIESYLQKPEIMDRAVNHIHQTYYPDFDKQEVLINVTSGDDPYAVKSRQEYLNYMQSPSYFERLKKEMFGDNYTDNDYNNVKKEYKKNTN